MFSIILYQPEIPPNTGNIIRLCANTGCQLHLIEPIGFQIEDKQLKRAGLDYHHLVNLTVHKDFSSFLARQQPARLFALSAKAKTCYTTPQFQAGDAFLFGPETRGLPTELLATFDEATKLTLPQKTSDRSLNLANTVSVMIYEAWRQLGFQ